MKASLLLLITLSNEGTKILPDDQKPVALLCIGCALITPSVLLFLKSVWKSCHKTSKLPRKTTTALVLFFEFLVSVGAAILIIVAMPHLDIVTNVTILNSVAIFSALLQVVAQCTSKERNRFLLPSITAFILILLGFVLFLVLYIIKDPTDTQMAIWVGLAVGGAFLVSLNWWENYFRVICKNTNSTSLKNLCKDITRCRNMLHILSSLIRIVVTACVLGAYIPLANMDWDIVTSIPRRETRIIAIIIGVQLISSALCHWFSLVACKMHALRRCFILPFIFQNIDEKLFRKQQQIPDQTIIRTPYGGRLVVTMPHGNNIVVHFKDKELIRHKKRWSQIMYLYYLLGYKLMTKHYSRWRTGDDEKELKEKVEKHNTYLLALDGDTDFQPGAVMLLIDRMKMYPQVGAVCGRIHPTGSGPAVWFQKFEYAVSHWLQKTAEHVYGCVLCSPGCFSLYRAAALMDDNVMKRYSTKSMEASHYIQYDQGEDRWLCNLFLKQGWRVEYNSASDAYTNAPESFKELYNQRRRWGPSTLANIVDLLGSTTILSKRNLSISKLYMFYQLFAIISVILAPATICLMAAGSLSFIFDIDAGGALIIAVIPPAIYLGLCFHLKADTQITIAAIMSVMYAFLMLVVSVSIVGEMVSNQTILTPSSLFVISMAVIFVVTAIMHPQEFHLIFYGLLYIVCVPSAYLLLTIYSMVNMNNISWGTRETKPAAGAAPAEANIPWTGNRRQQAPVEAGLGTGGSGTHLEARQEAGLGTGGCGTLRKAGQEAGMGTGDRGGAHLEAELGTNGGGTPLEEEKETVQEARLGPLWRPDWGQAVAGHLWRPGRRLDWHPSGGVLGSSGCGTPMEPGQDAGLGTSSGGTPLEAGNETGQEEGLGLLWRPGRRPGWESVAVGLLWNTGRRAGRRPDWGPVAGGHGRSDRCRGRDQVVGHDS
ncbi:chitin synthase chs-2-like [Acanthochromis polyacanthus]|uniref:chitin synthase chs-2-like n=1 Tax=Acanthochromis polyacanthus TaxID=80966 RepID=UPI002234BE6D|nr:chitin synthase chs-2-like [Acanthochromis polyacanthus]